MTIQFNTDKNITGSTYKSAFFKDYLNTDLSRFSKQITRLEVHLSDENGHKEGQNDIRCLIEARLEGRQLIAVSNNAISSSLAVIGASEKLKNSLETIIGRARNY